jgi:hypothetical protein
MKERMWGNLTNLRMSPGEPGLEMCKYVNYDNKREKEEGIMSG